MDKQAAIDFVLDELDKGHSLSEITAALSRQLGAPGDLVGKFVTQTAERYAQAKGAGHQPPATSQQPTAANRPATGYNQPATEYSQQPTADNQQPIAYYQQATEFSQRATAYERQPADDDGEHVTTAAETMPLPAPYYEPAPVEALPPAGKEAVVTPELEKFILGELGKNKRESDIVLAVVERTGMEYRQAQRMVSRVGVQNYKKVAAKQNCLIVPLALIFLIAGLVLLGASIVEGYQLRFILNSPNNLSGEQIQQAYERGRDLPWAFITGLALSLGGSIGLFSALRKQMD